MGNAAIKEIQRVFDTRLETLEHIIQVGETHFGDGGFLAMRLVDDMLPFAAQVAFACNAPRGFAQWCAGEPVENIKPDSIGSLAQAREAIAQTRAQVAGIGVDDAKLEEIKRVGLGPGRYCELPGHQYLADYVVPNLYFHLTTAYAILRQQGAPLGKSDFLMVLRDYVRTE